MERSSVLERALESARTDPEGQMHLWVKGSPSRAQMDLEFLEIDETEKDIKKNS